MTRVRCITEMGMGVDVHGKDVTKAASVGVRCHPPLQPRLLPDAGQDRQRHVRRCDDRRPRPRRGQHLGGRQGAALRNGDGHRGQGRAGNSGRAGRRFHHYCHCRRDREFGRWKFWSDIRREGRRWSVSYQPNASSCFDISQRSGETMRRSEIAEQNRYLLERQRQFRVAADVVTDAWMWFEEVLAVAVIGSVAGPLWKEVPCFSEFRREQIEVWHECGDLDLALWLELQLRLGALRHAAGQALRKAFGVRGSASASLAISSTCFCLSRAATVIWAGCVRSTNVPRASVTASLPAVARFPSTSESPSSSRVPAFWRRRPTRCSMSAAWDGCAPRSICQPSFRIGPSVGRRKAIDDAGDP